jgi:type IV pilus assembly protein PilB
MEIGKVAVEQGMRTLRDDGWMKVGEGRTSIEEILRVVA